MSYLGAPRSDSHRPFLDGTPGATLSLLVIGIAHQHRILGISPFSIFVAVEVILIREDPFGCLKKTPLRGLDLQRARLCDESCLIEFCGRCSIEICAVEYLRWNAAHKNRTYSADTNSEDKVEHQDCVCSSLLCQLGMQAQYLCDLICRAVEASLLTA